jgi:hypothetical protein
MIEVLSFLNFFLTVRWIRNELYRLMHLGDFPTDPFVSYHCVLSWLYFGTAYAPLHSRKIMWSLHKCQDCYLLLRTWEAALWSKYNMGNRAENWCSQRPSRARACACCGLDLDDALVNIKRVLHLMAYVEGTAPPPHLLLTCIYCIHYIYNIYCSMLYGSIWRNRTPHQRHRMFGKRMKDSE